jgi:hypothetical protein
VGAKGVAEPLKRLYRKQPLASNFPPPRQLEVLVAVATGWKVMRRSPTCQEIAVLLGLKSAEAVRQAMNKLVERGLVVRTTWRAVRLTPLGRGLIWGDTSRAREAA